MRWGLLIIVAVLAAPAGAQCTPDARYSPTPTFAWDPPSSDREERGIAAYRVRWRWYDPADPDPGWSDTCCQVTLPCETIVDEDTGGTWKRCPRGGTIPPDIPLQRYTNAQRTILEVCVAAIDHQGLESECDIADVDDEVPGKQTQLCMPALERF